MKEKITFKIIKEVLEKIIQKKTFTLRNLEEDYMKLVLE